jgi:magnesium transporter
MLTAFVRNPDGTCDTLSSVDAVAQSRHTEGSFLWIDLEQPGEETLRAVGELFGLSSEALEDCIHGAQRPRIDEYEDHIFLVLYGMPGIEDDDRFEPRKLAVFCGSRFLVTVHRDPLLSVREIRARCDRHAPQILRQGPDFVLYSIIDRMVDRYIAVAEAYEKRLDALEDVSLRKPVSESLLSDLSLLRRDLLELKHIAVSQRELIIPIANGEYEYISDTLDTHFAHVRDHLTQVVELVESQRELLNSVRDNYHFALADRMSDRVKTLTLFATLLLPLSLIAGIYGMNLPVWPPSDRPWSFWLVLGVMAVLAAGMLTYFRRQRWL